MSDIYDLMGAQPEPTYPVAPGYKARETSKAAAENQKAKSPALRQMCLDQLRRLGGLTADECAHGMGVDKLSIRPRFSELAAANRIEDTGFRRLNDSGKSAIVWVLR